MSAKLSGAQKVLRASVNFLAERERERCQNFWAHQSFAIMYTCTGTKLSIFWKFSQYPLFWKAMWCKAGECIRLFSLGMWWDNFESCTWVKSQDLERQRPLRIRSWEKGFARPKNLNLLHLGCCFRMKMCKGPSFPRANSWSLHRTSVSGWPPNLPVLAKNKQKNHPSKIILILIRNSLVAKIISEYFLSNHQSLTRVNACYHLRFLIAPSSDDYKILHFVDFVHSF